MTIRWLACAALSLGVLGCGGGGTSFSFEGSWLVIEDTPDDGQYGPASIVYMSDAGGAVSFLGASFPKNGQSFGGWYAGDAASGTYVGGVYAGDVLTVTMELYAGGTVVETMVAALTRSTHASDGTVSADNAGTVYNYTGAIAFEMPSVDTTEFMQSDPDQYLLVVIGCVFTTTGTYTIGSEIDTLFFENDFWGAHATGGTVTITAITSTRLAGTYSLNFTYPGIVTGSFDMPLAPGVPPASDEHESDASSGTAKTITIDGALMNHTFHERGDEDYVAIAIAAPPSTLYIETMALGDDTDTVLTLYDTNGSSLLASDYDGGAAYGASLIQYTFNSADTYYVRVSNTYSLMGHYSLEVRTTP